MDPDKAEAPGVPSGSPSTAAAPELEPGWVDFLVSLDEAIARGGTPQVEAAEGALESAQVLRLLETVWPRHAEQPRLPAQIGRFEIRQVLGHGGFATVYRAFDPLRRSEVALKVPHVNVRGSSDLCRRFLREAQAAAALDHPHIQPIFEVGEAPPVWYLSSAYCDGPTLAQWLASRPPAQLPPSTAARFIKTLAEAVQHMHGRGVLHRDLKPSNILLDGASSDCQPLERYVPKIADFGLAKVLDETEGDTVSRTILGTPEYMAPEQAEGRRMLGPGVDIYSLGCLLYELLTGQPPITAPSKLEILRRLATHEVTPPRKLRPKLPADLEAICLKCLEKQPARRYVSAADLAADLERFLAGTSTMARPLPGLRRLGRWMARHRWLTAAAALLVILPCLVVAGLIIHERKLQDLNVQLTQSAQHLRRAAAAAYDAEQLADERRRRAEMQVYAADLSLACEYFREGRLGLMGEVLAKYHTPKDEDLRSFTWRYLWHQGRRLRWFRTGAAATALAYDRASDRWVAATARGQVHLLDPAHLTAKQTWQSGLTEPQYSALSADGRLVLFGAWTPTWKTALGVWDGGSESWAFREQVTPGVGPRCQGLSADGRFWLEAGNRPAGETRVRETGTNRVVVTWKVPGYFATAFAVAAQDRRWAVAFRKADATQPGPSFILRLYEADRVTYRELPAPAEVVWVLAFHANDRRLLVGVFGGPSSVHDVDTGAVLHALPISADDTNTLAISSDGRWLAGLHAERRLTLIDADTGKPVLHHDLERGIYSVAFGPGNVVAVGTSDGLVHLWQPFFDDPPSVLKTHSPHECWSVVFDPAGRWFATAGDDSLVRSWTSAGAPSATLQAHASLASCLAVSPDGRWLASGSYDDRVIVWDTATWTRKHVLSGHTHDVRCLAFAHDGRTLASAGRDRLIHLWDVEAGSLQQKLPPHERQVRGLAFAANRDLLISCGDEGQVRFWNGSTGALLYADNPQSPCWSVAVVPSGSTALVGTKDGTLLHYNLERLSEPPIRRNIREGIHCLAVSPDGHTLATGSLDKAVRLWHVPTQQVMLTLATLEHQINSLAFSADGRTLAAALHDGTTVRWSVPSE